MLPMYQVLPGIGDPKYSVVCCLVVSVPSVLLFETEVSYTVFYHCVSC